MRHIRVRYWAAAKAAAGTPEDLIPADSPLTVAELVRRCADLHPGRLGAVLDICSVLVDGEQAASTDPASTLVAPGASVEFLPPFAGG